MTDINDLINNLINDPIRGYKKSLEAFNGCGMYVSDFCEHTDLDQRDINKALREDVKDGIVERLVPDCSGGSFPPEQKRVDCCENSYVWEAKKQTAAGRRKTNVISARLAHDYVIRFGRHRDSKARKKCEYFRKYISKHSNDVIYKGGSIDHDRATEEQLLELRREIRRGLYERHGKPIRRFFCTAEDYGLNKEHDAHCYSLANNMIYKKLFGKVAMEICLERSTIGVNGGMIEWGRHDKPNSSDMTIALNFLNKDELELVKIHMDGIANQLEAFKLSRGGTFYTKDVIKVIRNYLSIVDGPDLPEDYRTDDNKRSSVNRKVKYLFKRGSVVPRSRILDFGDAS